MVLKTADQQDEYRQRITLAADYISKQTKTRPQVLLVLGSGLGALADAVQDAVIVPYGDIPGFPQATVPGHAGRLVLGRWQQRDVAVMQGRFHYYEGHSLSDVVLPIRVSRQLGVGQVILTNAAGGVEEDMRPGDLMLIRDHLGFFGESPLRGLNLDEFGPRFPDQSRVYDPGLAELALKVADRLNIRLRQGIYSFSRGPQFETPAEIRALRGLGASAVGMSTVPEALTAVHGGQKVLAVSCITNLAAGILDQPLSHEEVMEVGAGVAAKTIRLLSGILGDMPV